MNGKTLNEARQIMSGFLKNRRIELGITQADLAAKTGLGIATIKRVENGNFWIGLKQFLLICEALKLSPTFIKLEDKI